MGGKSSTAESSQVERSIQPRHVLWFIGYDWTGKPRATINLAQPLGSDQVLRQAPDGQELALNSNGKGGGQFLDRLGNLIPQVQPAAGGIWADDNRRTCGVEFDTQKYTYTLVTLTPGEAPRSVTLIARDSAIGQTGIDVVACSFKNDEAIAVRTNIAWPGELWIVRLSDGTVLAHRTEPVTALTNIVASPDVACIAENSSAGSQLQDVQSAPSTVVRRVSDWQVVLTLPAQSQVLAFSSDCTHVLISKQPYQYPGPTHLEVIDWAVPHGVWNYDGPEALWSSIALLEALTSRSDSWRSRHSPPAPRRRIPSRMSR